MATKFPILPHYPINADDQACLSALAVLVFVVCCVYVLCQNVKQFVMRLFWKKWCINNSGINVQYIQEQAENFIVNQV